MKKIILTIVMGTVLGIAFLGTAGYVYAQTSTPHPFGFGPGMMGGRGQRGGGMMNNGQEGFLHDEMEAAFDPKLGMSVSDLEARLDNGETMAQVAYSKGITAEQFTTMMTEARAQAVDQAVKDGKLTQAGADWMKQRSVSGMGAGCGANGQGRFTNSNCPYATSAAQ
jgi:hypothetical protein